ncbi:hypothetical protein ACFL3M_01725 [Patescibacteria group bacterium]
MTDNGVDFSPLWLVAFVLFLLGGLFWEALKFLSRDSGMTPLGFLRDNIVKIIIGG